MSHALIKTHPLYKFSIIVVLIVTAFLAIIIVTTAFRRPKTQIELIVETTDLSFTTPKNIGTQNLLENLRLANIGFGDVASIQVGNRAPVTLGSSFPLRLAKIPGTDATLILEQFNLPKSSTLYFNVSPVTDPSVDTLTPIGRLTQLIPKRLAHVSATLIRCGPAIDSFEMPDQLSAAKLDCNYQLEIDVAGEDAIEVRSPVELDLQDGSLLLSAAPFRNTARMLAFDFEAAQERLQMASQIKVADISFARVDEFSDANDASYSIGTGIESGTLYLEELGGQEIQLRPGEELSFEVVSGGLRTVELGDETMSVEFSGSVRDLKTGERSLMPTWFAYVFEKDFVKAIFAAVGTMTALAISLGAWLLPRT